MRVNRDQPVYGLLFSGHRCTSNKLYALRWCYYRLFFAADGLYVIRGHGMSRHPKLSPLSTVAQLTMRVYFLISYPCPAAVHDSVLVHRLRHTFVPDRPRHRQPVVSPAEMRQRRAGANTGRVRVHHVLSDVLGQAGRLPVGAHQNATGPDCQQNVPEPLHTDAHPGHAVLHWHDNRPGPTQDEEFVVQNQQSERARKIP